MKISGGNAAVVHCILRLVRLHPSDLLSRKQGENLIKDPLLKGGRSDSGTQNEKDPPLPHNNSKGGINSTPSENPHQLAQERVPQRGTSACSAARHQKSQLIKDIHVLRKQCGTPTSSSSC
eukprot:6198755-Amphidinium_carterae.1